MACLSLGAFFEVVNQCIARGKPRVALGTRFLHRGSGASVRRLQRERKLLLGDDTRQKDTDRIRNGQAHRGQSFSRLALDMLLHPNMDHRGRCRYVLLELAFEWRRRIFSCSQANAMPLTIDTGHAPITRSPLALAATANATS